MKQYANADPLQRGEILLIFGRIENTISLDSQGLFYLLITIIVLDFLIDQFLDWLNARHFGDPVPPALKDVFDQEEYQKSQRYKRTRFKFGMVTASVSFLFLLLFLLLDGFAMVDALARSLSDNPIAITVLFFAFLFLLADLLNLPFSYYSTFVIEERFGFNKTDLRTFATDKLKSWGMMLLLGGGILALITWFYLLAGEDFWWYAWILIAAFSLFLNMFYARLIVPLFNKQEPLEEGPLREKIEAYASKMGFTLDKIFVIDGSRRSTKANAYFSGFGSEKRVTLYDTLIQDLDDEEIVAVLAHEVGHYKKHHILINMSLSIVLTGITLWVLSLMIGNPVLAEALGVHRPAFHIGLVAFGILYSPISEITGIVMNFLSRKFEFQADDFAKRTFSAPPLVTGLKKLSRKSLSNLTPHPAYVFVHYSHPPLDERLRHLGT